MNDSQRRFNIKQMLCMSLIHVLQNNPFILAYYINVYYIKSTHPTTNSMPRRNSIVLQIVRRARGGRINTRILREIKKYQKTTHMLIPRAAFKRLVKEIGQDFDPTIRFAKDSYEALQQAAEHEMYKFFDCAQILALHRRRQTVLPCDFNILRFLRRQFGNF